MRKIDTIRPAFIERIPKILDDGVLYVSLKYGTAAHSCCCGCGVKIVTPIKPGRWELDQKDDVVSLYPSVGNWSADCQSHYWIRNNRIDWSHAYTPEQIAANRASDQRAREQAHAERYFRELGFWGRFWHGTKGLWQALKHWF
jgi:hypothetical protein